MLPVEKPGGIVDGIADQIRRAAQERYGLSMESRDYTVERVVRLTMAATDSRYASFSVLMDGCPVHVAATGAGCDDQSVYQPLVDALIGGETLRFIDDLDEALAGTDAQAAARGTDAKCAAVAPVFGASKAVIGHLTVLCCHPCRLDTEANRRVLNDGVRLIEDALSMRSDAVRDVLTGLYNRRFFNQQIASEWRRAMRLQQPISVLLADIDHFKRYNDAVGHLSGDEAIRIVAQVIASKARRAGDVSSRFGGEEFAMILPMTPAPDAAMLAESIRRAVATCGIDHPDHPRGGRRPLTVSIGVATMTSRLERPRMTAMELLGAADEALYQAKQAGRNCTRQADLDRILSEGPKPAAGPIPAGG